MYINITAIIGFLNFIMLIEDLPLAIGIFLLITAYLAFFVSIFAFVITANNLSCYYTRPLENKFENMTYEQWRDWCKKNRW